METRIQIDFLECIIVPYSLSITNKPHWGDTWCQLRVKEKKLTSMVVRKLSSGQAITNVHIKHCPSSHMQVFEQWQFFRVKRSKLLPECVSTKWQKKIRKGPSSHHSHMWHHSGSSYLDCHLVHPQLPQSAITEVLSMIRNFKCIGQVWQVCKHVQHFKNIMEVERHESEWWGLNVDILHFNFMPLNFPSSSHHKSNNKQ